MKNTRLTLALPALLLGLLLGVAWIGQPVGVEARVGEIEPDLAAAGVALDRAFDRYWAAESAEERAAAAQRILAASGDFDAIFTRLRAGRPYAAKVRRGRVQGSRRNRDGLAHRYFFFVPEHYDPARRYPVRVYLHGGINRPPFQLGDEWWRDAPRLRSEDHIAVFPASWRDSRWWEESQVENLTGILDRLKRTYNVDENRVHLLGVSDGGSGAYYQALRHPTPWAGFLPFIGHVGVVLNERWADGDFHLPNLTNRPFFVVNGEIDHLYPVSAVRPWIDLFRRAGVEVVFRPKQGRGHTVSWWPEEAANIESFIAEHSREPFPDRLAWEAEAGGRFNRVHWVVVDEIGSTPGDSAFPDAERSPVPHQRPFGRIEAERRGNTFTVRTRGVRRYTLLLPTEKVDLGSPVRVVTNGRLSFEGTLEPDLGTLLDWAARDNDRTMLFAAELEITVDPAPTRALAAPVAALAREVSK